MTSSPSRTVLLDLYRRMTLIKQNDERFRATIKDGKSVAPYYSPRGQEVIPSAVSVNLRDTRTHSRRSRSVCGQHWRVPMANRKHRDNVVSRRPRQSRGLLIANITCATRRICTSSEPSVMRYRRW